MQQKDWNNPEITVLAPLMWKCSQRNNEPPRWQIISHIHTDRLLSQATYWEKVFIFCFNLATDKLSTDTEDLEDIEIFLFPQSCFLKKNQKQTKELLL